MRSSNSSAHSERASGPLPVSSAHDGEEETTRPAALCPRRDGGLLYSVVSRKLLRHNVGEFMLQHRAKRTAKRIAEAAHALESLRGAVEKLYAARDETAYGSAYWKCANKLRHARTRVAALSARTPDRIVGLMHHVLETLARGFKACPPSADLPPDLIVGIARL